MRGNKTSRSLIAGPLTVLIVIGLTETLGITEIHRGLFEPAAWLQCAIWVQDRLIELLPGWMAPLVRGLRLPSLSLPAR